LGQNAGERGNSTAAVHDEGAENYREWAAGHHALTRPPDFDTL